MYAANVKLEDYYLECIDSFPYLRGIISKNNSIRQELNNKLRKGAEFFQQVTSLLRHKIPVKAKVVMNNSYFKDWGGREEIHNQHIPEYIDLCL